MPENATTAAEGAQTENRCERWFWALQDANYNVIGLVNAAGLLVERYEYTPYGERTIYSRNWLLADFSGDGTVDGSDYTIYADHYGSSHPDSPADANGDGKVDGSDYSIWADHNGESYAAGDALVTYPVLESARGQAGPPLRLPTLPSNLPAGRQVYTRRGRGGKLIRRRECRHCGKRMTTWERPVGA